MSGEISKNYSPGRDLEVVTIVFDREIELFRLQARSLARNLSSEFRRLHVILNEYSSSNLHRDVKAIIDAEFGRTESERVCIWSSNELLSQTDRRGWLTQQILKLKIASHIDAEKYVVLDAKNHLIRKAGVDNFLSPDGRPYMARTWNSGPLKNYIIGSLRTFGLDQKIADGRFMPSVTPFTLYRQHVLDMIKYVERIHARDFVDYFLHGENLVSEFGLYAAYFLLKDIDIETAYFCDRSICVTLWPQWAPTEDRQLSQLSLARNESCVMLGLHRTSIAILSESARSVVSELWSGAGLFESIADAQKHWQTLETSLTSETA